MGTYQSGIYFSGPRQWPASKLVDGFGLDGVWGCGGCATAERGEGFLGPEYFSLELDVPQIVTKVQIVRRMDYTEHQGHNVTISVGQSKYYEEEEPLCLPEIPELQERGGFVDYNCTKEVKGKYVKISSTESTFSLCEVKVFILSEGKLSLWIPENHSPH